MNAADEAAKRQARWLAEQNYQANPPKQARTTSINDYGTKATQPGWNYPAALFCCIGIMTDEINELKEWLVENRPDILKLMEKP